METTETQRSRAADSIAPLMPETPERKVMLDKMVKSVIDGLHDSYPGVDDAVLANFSHAIAFMMSKFMTLSLADLSSTMENMFYAYSFTVAALYGVYQLGGPLAGNRHHALPVPGADSGTQNTGMYL